MKSLLTPFIFVYCWCSLYAQDSTYSKVFHSPTVSYGAKAFTVANDEQIAQVGTFSYANDGIVLSDSLGDIITSKAFSTGSLNFQSITLNSILSASDNSLLAVGASWLANQSGGKGLIVKCNYNLDTIWTRELALPGQDKFELQDVIALNDSVFVAVGYDHQNNISAVQSFDTDGNYLWGQTFSEILMLEKIRKQNDSTLILCGNIPNLIFGYDGMVASMKTDGSINWAIQLGSYQFEDLLVDTTGIFIADLDIYQSVGLLHYDLDGIFVEHLQINQMGGAQVESLTMEKSPSGTFLLLQGSQMLGATGLCEVNIANQTIATYSIYTNARGIKNTTNGSGYHILGKGPIYGIKKLFTDEHTGLIRTNHSFNNIMCLYPSNTLSTTPLSETGIITSISPAANGSLLFTTLNIIDVALSTADGCVDAYGEISENEIQQFDVFPNPSTGTIQVQQSEDRMAELTVYDTYGKVVFTHTISSAMEILDLNHLSKGIYSFKMIRSNQTVGSGKLVLTR